MKQKRMTLTLFNRSDLKQQLDNLLESDYRLLNQHHNQKQAILQCQLTKNNHIIKQYIQVVEEEYNFPSPIKKYSSKNSSKKKLQLSIINSARQHIDIKGGDKNKKKLTLTTPTKEDQSNKIGIMQNPQENSLIATPKFSYFKRQSELLALSRPSSTSLNNPSSIPHVNSANKLQSKQKPRNSNHHRNNTSTANKAQIFSQTYISQLSHHNFESRATVKRHKIEGSDNLSDSDNYNHNNPIIEKVHRRRLDEYCRPGKISNSIIQIQSKKLKIKQSYRYCIGCQMAVLQANIRSHQKECRPFQEISMLPSNRQILTIVQNKIAEIEHRIPSTEIDSEQTEIFKDRSASLVKQSRERCENSPQSVTFRKDYENIMQIGKKWCSSLQQINKLRWFTRVAQKLESIITQEQ